ncbi:MAG: winged helix-turn-helix domain-containing protein, partial [PVC group bacterium]|nr:winged helix-turn-helix domain-containing protein [PVC group bacterium]
RVRECKEYKTLSANSGGSDPKLSFAQSKELINHLEKSTYLKVSDICIYIREKYNIIYTIGGVTNCLKSNDFSYKKPKGVPSKADSKEQDKFVHEYKLILKKSSTNEPILFMDGVHPTMETKITYGWIRTGSQITQ